MKKAVLMVMVTLFAGSAFASSCSNKSNVGMFTSTKPVVSSTGTSGSEGTR